MENIEIYRNRINIMTSCDDNLTDYIFVQIRTMAMHLTGKEIHFYLFYNRIPEEKLDKLEIYCRAFGNIIFHRIFIEDIEFYVQLSKYGAMAKKKDGSPNLPCETYFAVGCHRYLPKDVDRILYIDAGDILFASEIDEFYFDDFEGKALIVSARTFKHDWSYFTLKDLSIPEYIKPLRNGIFNSGCYIMNIDFMRKQDISMDKIIAVIETLPSFEGEDFKYKGDEGILTILYIDKTKYFDFENSKELWYKPYNFTMGFFNKEEDGGLGGKMPWYTPKIIHYVSSYMPKPWKLIEGLIAEGVLEAGKTMSLRDILEIAAKTKYSDFNHETNQEIDVNIIEPGMIPYFEYWFNVNDIVQKELKQIFV